MAGCHSTDGYLFACTFSAIWRSFPIASTFSPHRSMPGCAARCPGIRLALTSPGFICGCVGVRAGGCMALCVSQIQPGLACKVICLSPVSAVHSGKMIVLNKIACRLHTSVHIQSHAHTRTSTHRHKHTQAIINELIPRGSFSLFTS